MRRTEFFPVLEESEDQYLKRVEENLERVCIQDYPWKGLSAAEGLKLEGAQKIETILELIEKHKVRKPHLFPHSGKLLVMTGEIQHTKEEIIKEARNLWHRFRSL